MATSSRDAFSGILGIGYGQGLATKYPNFIDQLHSQNVTKVKAYTLALGSKDAKEGTIVFGGVDTSKFSGPLAQVPIIPTASSPDKVPRFWVQMAGISLTPPNGESTAPYEGSQIPAFMDSGSTMTILPPKLAGKIAKDFGSPEPDANGFFRVGCEFVGMNGTLDFQFDAAAAADGSAGKRVTVQVPYKEMIREVGEGDAKTCFLGLMGSETFTLLGDTFLRSAYGMFSPSSLSLSVYPPFPFLFSFISCSFLVFSAHPSFPLPFLFSGANIRVAKAVFDLQTHSIWLTQASSCGSTPAALKDVTDLSRVVGKCETQPGQKQAVVDVVSETSIPAPSSPPTAGTGTGTGTGTDAGSGVAGGPPGETLIIATGFVTTTLAVPTGIATASGAAATAAGSVDGVSGIAATVTGGAGGLRSNGDMMLSVGVAVVVAVLGSLV